MHDVSVFYDIVFSFYIQFTSLAYSCFRTVFDKVVVLDDFCTDKSFLEVSMNNSGTFEEPSILYGMSMRGLPSFQQ